MTPSASVLPCSIALTTMSHSNSSFGIANPRTFSPQIGALTPMENGPNMQSGHLNGIAFTFDYPEGGFSCDGGTLTNTTAFQPEGGPVSTFPLR